MVLHKTGRPRSAAASACVFCNTIVFYLWLHPFFFFFVKSAFRAFAARLARGCAGYRCCCPVLLFLLLSLLQSFSIVNFPVRRENAENAVKKKRFPIPPIMSESSSESEVVSSPIYSSILTALQHSKFANKSFTTHAGKTKEATTYIVDYSQAAAARAAAKWQFQR